HKNAIQRVPSDSISIPPEQLSSRPVCRSCAPRDSTSDPSALQERFQGTELQNRVGGSIWVEHLDPVND
ncbi:hypothetical protein AAHH78_34665, partial [Burkholderia pseudomallei]